MENLKTFKIRCSAIGEIMSGTMGLTDAQKVTLAELSERKGNPAAKPLTAKMEADLESLIYKRDNPELPKGAKAYCEKWLKEQIYSRRKEFTSKFTDKGNAVEPIAFEMIGKHLGVTVSKNDEFFGNEYIEGTPDIIVTDALLIDAKSSWDCFSFPLFDDEVPAVDNYWQGQGYMDLTGFTDCKFIYCLCDTPEGIIKREARNYCFNNGFDVTPAILDEFTERLTYPGIDEKYKIKVFDIAKDDSAVKKIYERVKLCREYIKTITK